MRDRDHRGWTMSEQDNIRIAERWFDAMSAHDLSLQEGLRAPGYIFEAPDYPGPVGAKEDKAYTSGVIGALPDLHVEIAQIIAQDDFVVVNATLTGTNNGPLTLPNGQTVPASGKKMVMPLSNTFQFANGQVAHCWLYYDRLGAMAQSGAMPGM
jgi:predicted ester cyclase